MHEICYTVTYFDCIEFRHILQNRIDVCTRYGPVFVSSLFDIVCVFYVLWNSFDGRYLGWFYWSCDLFSSIRHMVYNQFLSFYFFSFSFSLLNLIADSILRLLYASAFELHMKMAFRWVAAFTLHTTNAHTQMWMFSPISRWFLNFLDFRNKHASFYSFICSSFLAVNHGCVNSFAH